MHTFIPKRVRTLLLITAAAAPLLAGCSSSDSPNPVTPPATGTLAVAVSPAAITVTGGTSGASTATITRGGSFTGDVALSSEGTPTGVTVTFGTASLGAGVTSSTVSVAVAASYTSTTPIPISIKATGTGVTATPATLTLTVTPAVTPTLAVSVAPTPVPIVAGASGTSVATIVRGGGFTGAVSVTATAAQAGITVTVPAAPIPADSATRSIAIAVAGSVPAGDYPVIVSAAGTGVTTATATVTARVSAPVVGSSVTLAYCAADAPIWVAYQDGTGPWTRVTASGTNTYTFTVNSAKAAVATVDTVGSGFDLSVTYGTPAEFNGFGNTLTLGGCATKTVNGTVAGVSASQLAFVTLGYSTKIVLPITSSAFSLTSVASGAQDLFAARLDGTTQRADKIILRRGLDIANNGSLAVLDFNASEAFAPVSSTVTVTGLGADTASIATLYSGQRGSTFGFLGTFADYINASGAVAYDAIPAAQLNSGELQQLYATADVANSTTSSRFVGVFFRTPGVRTLAMGPVLGTPTITRDATGPYSRTRVQLALQSEYNRYLSADFTQGSSNRSATITATTGFVGTGSWDLAVPDLTGAAGWNNTWGLLNGTPINWSLSATGGAIVQLDPTIADGTTFRSAQRSSSTPLP